MGIIKGETIIVNPVCWFFFPLIYSRILANVWLNRKYKWFSIFCFILGLLSFYKNVFYIAQTELAFPFFLVGYYMKDYIVKESEKVFSVRKNVILPFLLFGACVMLLYFNGRMNMGLIMLGKLPYGLNVISYFLSGLSGTLALIYFTFVFKNNNKYIVSASNALITCVGLQFLFFEGFTRYYSSGICAIVSLLIMFICIIIHKFFSHILPQYFR